MASPFVCDEFFQARAGDAQMAEGLNCVQMLALNQAIHCFPADFKHGRCFTRGEDQLRQLTD
jgi:hypothetical protein